MKLYIIEQIILEQMILELIETVEWDRICFRILMVE